MRKRNPTQFGLFVVVALGLFTCFLPASPVRAGLFDLSVSEERKIGEEMMKEIRQDYAIYQDWEITAIGELLKKSSKRPDLISDFWVFPDTSYNAFALPGGHIMINEGLLEALETQDEIAFIVGHESTHVVERHIASEVKRSRENSALTSIVLLAVGASTAVWRVGDFFNFVTMNQYSQKKERAADDGGYALASKVGFDPEAALSALEKLHKKYGDDSKTMNKLFGTHPLLKDREKRLQGRQAEVTVTAPRPEIKPPAVESGLPTLELQVKLPEGVTQPVLPVTKKQKKATANPVDSSETVSSTVTNDWNDNEGKSLRLSLGTELGKSEKLLVLRRWQLVRAKDRPHPDYALLVRQQVLTFVDEKRKDKVANVKVNAAILNNSTNESVWQKDFENSSGQTGKKVKGGPLAALAKDIAGAVRQFLVGEDSSATPKTSGKPNTKG